MAQYKGKSFKRKTMAEGGHIWTNVYNIQAADKTAAAIIMDSLAELEKEVYYDVVTIFRCTVSNVNPEAESGVSFLTNFQGGRGTPGNLLIPDWNVARVDFADGLNRPERKYLRCGFTEGDFEGSVIDAGLVDTIQSYATAAGTTEGHTGPQGETLTDYDAFPNLFMRQLSWGRRARPGQHRAYVNN